MTLSSLQNPTIKSRGQNKGKRLSNEKAERKKQTIQKSKTSQKGAITHSDLAPRDRASIKGLI